MANNFSAKDATPATQTFKSTDNAGVHTPHKNIDTITAGASADLGAVADAAVATDANGSLKAHVRGLVKIFAERFPLTLGQKTKANSLAVTLASDTDAIALAASNASIGGVKQNGLFYTVTQTLGSSADATATPLDITTAPANSANAVMIDDMTFSAAVDMVVTIKEAAGANLLLFHYKTAQGVVQFRPRAWLRASVNKKVQLTAGAAGQIYTWTSWHEQ